MDILFAFLIILPIYPIVGTLLFVVVEKSKTSLKMKMLIMTFGHPILTGIIAWLGCFFFSRNIAWLSVLVTLGTLLRIPFSDRKYFSKFANDDGVVTIHYLSGLSKPNSIKVATSEIKNVAPSISKRFIDKPSELTVTLQNQTLTFTILDRNIKVSL